MKNDPKTHTIEAVLPGSPAEAAGVKPGQIVLSMNGKPLSDIFDYYYLSDDETVELELSGLRARLDMLEEELDDASNACPRLQKQGKKDNALWNNEDFWVI